MTRQIARHKKLAIVKLARGGMPARTIAKRVGERVSAVRAVIATIEEDPSPWNAPRKK